MRMKRKSAALQRWSSFNDRRGFIETESFGWALALNT